MSDRQLVALDDGRTADLTDADKWDEDTYWDGNNNVSCATGSQWNHETLHRTKRGSWIIWHTSQVQGTPSGYRECENPVHWLTANGHDLPDDMPEPDDLL